MGAQRESRSVCRSGCAELIVVPIRLFHFHFHFHLLLLLLLDLLLLSPLAAATPGATHDHAYLLPSSTTRIVFASCHKTSYSHDQVWANIAKEHPDAFWWIGDSVYTQRSIRQSHGPLNALQWAYNNMTNDVHYTKFLHESRFQGVVQGVWDDHDYGVNDGGKNVKDRHKRQEMFLNFLQVPDGHGRRARDGVYSSVSYVKDQPLAQPHGIVDVIFLDTRSHRDDHYIPSLGASNVPFGAILATMTRLL